MKKIKSMFNTYYISIHRYVCVYAYIIYVCILGKEGYQKMLSGKKVQRRGQGKYRAPPSHSWDRDLSEELLSLLLLPHSPIRQESAVLSFVDNKQTYTGQNS